ncbi:AP2-ERF domain [Babesia duncani]|uniref:AP2-ERF domain n=1 Tax=Babesia duncani TaxID=323732 RepID=A0AAD9UNW4_9APIC|nr:AP2-ERF domain [Babesia duncani]
MALVEGDGDLEEVTHVLDSSTQGNGYLKTLPESGTFEHLDIYYSEYQNTSVHDSEFKGVFDDVDTITTNVDSTPVADSDLGLEHFDDSLYRQGFQNAYNAVFMQKKGCQVHQGDFIKSALETAPFFEDDFRCVTKRIAFCNAQGIPQGHYSNAQPLNHSLNAQQASRHTCCVNATRPEESISAQAQMQSQYHQMPQGHHASPMGVVPADGHGGSIVQPGTLELGMHASHAPPPTSTIAPGNVGQPLGSRSRMIPRMNPFGMDYSYSDLYLATSLTNKCENLVMPNHANSNYCVYVGADYNALVCNCNMSRYIGGNAHATSCNVVAAEVEMSTESMPVSKASRLYGLVDKWENHQNGDMGMEQMSRMNSSATTLSTASTVSSFPSHPNNLMLDNSSPYSQATAVHTLDDAIAQRLKQQQFNCQQMSKNYYTPKLGDAYIQRVRDMAKNGNTLVSEIAGIHSDDVEFRHSQLMDSLAEKRNRIQGNMQQQGVDGNCNLSLNLPLNFLPQAESQSNIASQAKQLSAAAKAEKKKHVIQHHHHHSGEKVSGVWYDTNRHLWRVVYMKGNKRKTQGFSSIKLGYEEARRKAIQMRHEMVALRRTDKI